MVRAWISIGSNIDPHTNVSGALAMIREEYGNLRLSPLYKTAAVGFKASPFLNLVAGIDTPATATELIRRLSEIEAKFGRTRTSERFSSRTLDLDLLTYGDQVLNASGKTLPREDITKYAFVLKPLADVAPEERHPVSGRTYAEIWDNFEGDRSGLQPIDSAFLEQTPEA